MVPDIILGTRYWSGVARWQRGALKANSRPANMDIELASAECFQRTPSLERRVKPNQVRNARQRNCNSGMKQSAGI